MPRVSLAEYITEYLSRIGVRRVYGIIGTSIVDFVDALYSAREKIRYVSTRHEQVAVSMADAEYRVARNLGVAAVHAGPGFLNSLISLGIAYKDRIPLLLISGGVKRRLKGTDSWLEVDQESIASSIAKATKRVNNPEEITEIIPSLIKSMLKWPRGPALLEVPEDTWTKTVEYSSFPSSINELLPSPREPSDDQVKEIYGELISADKPLIVVSGEAIGPNITSLTGELAERLGAYIVTSGNARGSCDEEQPRCLGRVGFGGGSLPADKALEEADYVLVLGDELDDITTYSYTVYPQGDITIVSENPIINKRPIYYTHLINASPYRFIAKLVDEARKNDLRKENKEWDKILNNFIIIWNNMLNEAVSRRYEGFVNPSRFFLKLSEKLNPDDIVTGGQGTHIVYTYDFIRIKKPGRFLAATNLGAMGYAFPAALGAKLASPESQVIAVVGDGEFMMTLQDLETAVREKIPVKIIVVNDNSYRVLYLRQAMQKGGRIYGTLHGNPSFEALAKAFGATGITVDSDDQIDDAIEEMLNSNKPFVVDLIISREDLPPLNIEGSLRMGG